MPPKSRPLTAARRILEVLRRLGVKEDVVEIVPALLPSDMKPAPSSIKTYLDVLVKAGLAEKTVKYLKELRNNVAVYKLCVSKLEEFVRAEERKLAEEWAKKALERRPKTLRIPADTPIGEYIAKLREELYSLRKTVKKQTETIDRLRKQLKVLRAAVREAQRILSSELPAEAKLERLRRVLESALEGAGEVALVGTQHAEEGASALEGKA